jgi:hypothetical protein
MIQGHGHFTPTVRILIKNKMQKMRFLDEFQNFYTYGGPLTKLGDRWGGGGHGVNLIKLFWCKLTYIFLSYII